jgi:hypothetical protein
MYKVHGQSVFDSKIVRNENQNNGAVPEGKKKIGAPRMHLTHADNKKDLKKWESEITHARSLAKSLFGGKNGNTPYTKLWERIVKNYDRKKHALREQEEGATSGTDAEMQGMDGQSRQEAEWQAQKDSIFAIDKYDPANMSATEMQDCSDDDLDIEALLHTGDYESVYLEIEQDPIVHDVDHAQCFHICDLECSE